MRSTFDPYHIAAIGDSLTASRDAGAWSLGWFPLLCDGLESEFGRALRREIVTGVSGGTLAGMLTDVRGKRGPWPQIVVGQGGENDNFATPAQYVAAVKAIWDWIIENWKEPGGTPPLIFWGTVWNPGAGGSVAGARALEAEAAANYGGRVWTVPLLDVSIGESVKGYSEDCQVDGNGIVYLDSALFESRNATWYGQLSRGENPDGLLLYQPDEGWWSRIVALYPDGMLECEDAFFLTDVEYEFWISQDIRWANYTSPAGDLFHPTNKGHRDIRGAFVDVIRAARAGMVMRRAAVTVSRSALSVPRSALVSPRVVA